MNSQRTNEDTRALALYSQRKSGRRRTTFISGRDSVWSNAMSFGYPKDDKYIAAWLKKAKREGWRHPELIVEAVRADPNRLAEGLDYCMDCDKAIADLRLILGDLDEDDPRLIGAKTDMRGDEMLCDECWMGRQPE
jgi:hypothetical protein